MKVCVEAQSLSLRFLPLAMALFAACDGHGGSGPDTTPTSSWPQAHRQFRAITGISMGAFGAMNLGTKHADLFGTIAALGGPVDMRQLLRDMVNDNLEVKSQTNIPLEDSIIQDLIPAIENTILQGRVPQ